MRFSEVTASAGLKALVSAYGLSLGDWNGDQCLDLFVGSHGGPSHLFEGDCEGRFIDRIEQFGTDISYHLSRDGAPPSEGVFLAPSLMVDHDFRVNHETFLFHAPRRPSPPHAAYFIWRDFQTMAWRIRWGGEQGAFTGTITWSLPATVKSHGFTAVDTIQSSAHSLVFASQSLSGEEKGVDILISPFLRADLTLTFDVQVNGEYVKEAVYIGGVGAHPWQERFSLGAFSPLWVQPSYHAGADVGYFLWTTPEDGVWHLRWSNNGNPHLFHGTIQTQKGTFAVTPSSLPQTQTHIEVVKNALHFRSNMRSGEAGFDFTVSSRKRQGVIELALLIDGRPAALRAGAWPQPGDESSSFSYSQSFVSQRFFFPALPAAAFVVTPEVVSWPGDNGHPRMYQGDIEATRPISHVTLTPDLTNPRVETVPHRVSFAASSTGTRHTLQISYEGVRAFGDRHAAVWGDLDNDGYTDLYISNGGARGIGNIWGGELWHNSDGRDYRDEGLRKGVNDPDGRGRGVALVDFDNDGYLDIFKANTERPCRLFHNRQGRFEEIAAQVGIAGPFGAYNPISSSWADVDQDGYMDLLLVANPIRLFKNINGRFFQDVTAQAGLEGQYMVHAASWGDYDNDGKVDLYLSKAYGITQLRSSANVLFRNNGDGTFTNRTRQAGIGSRGNSRDATWFDFDNDGDLDLYVVNSTSILSFAPWFFRPVLPVWLKLLQWNAFDHTNILYENLGNGTFRDITGQAGVAGMGAESGVAVGDLNSDGLVDLVLASGYYPLETGELKVYQNPGNSNSWIALHLMGRESNRSAIGAKVFLYTGSGLQFRELNGGIHGFSQDSPFVHFGLGTSQTVDRLEVWWPSGKQTRRENLSANQLLSVRE